MAGAAPATSSSRYDTILKLASGGMATVWVGTVRGALGFRQLVAIKKPHPHLLGDPTFRSEIVAEARLASMIHHANVVDVRDVEIDGESISLVMDYIEGASLGELLVASSAAGQKLPPRVAVRIAVDALAGLHAAHELVDERGRPVGLVHRDVSPQNILVGTDGIARVADFGVAKFARKNMAATSDGSLKGKLAYMAPEYLRGEAIDRRFDVFGLGVVLWEALSGERCFRRKSEADTLQALLSETPALISAKAPEIGEALDAILACALMKERDERFQNAAAMAAALESTAGAAQLIAGHVEVAATVKALAGAAIEERRTLVRAKLANEPSVASLLGVPAVPKDLRIKAEASPAVDLDAATRTDVVAPTQVVKSVVPSTLPMTPRMEGAPAAPGARTLPSEVGTAPVRAPSAGNVNATHLSAGVAAPVAEPSAPAGSLRVSASTPEGPPAPRRSSTPEGLPAPRRWLAPLLVGVATAAIAGGVGFAVWRSKAADPAQAPSAAPSLPAAAPPAPVPSASSAVAGGATPAGATPEGSRAATPEGSRAATPEGSRATPEGSSAVAPTPRPTGGRPVRTVPATVHGGPATSAPAPSATSRKPPPNPYDPPPN